MFDIIIVGAGVAGMTAAIYARRAAKKVLVFEAKSYGGQIINTLDIENYPAEAHVSGFDLATKMYAQAKELGAEFVFEKVAAVRDAGEFKEVVIESGGVYRAKAVIIATGSENRKLGILNEDELTGKGVSYCATCDGAFYKQKAVAVVGGGNTALEDALYLSGIAAKVYLVHRREEFRGAEATVLRLREKENVEFVYNSNVTELVISDEGRLAGVKVINKNGEVRTLEVCGLFVAIGRVPENAEFAGLIALDEAGYALAGEDCATGVAGVFVAGDNRAKEVRQLVTAASDGAVAASNAVKFVNGL